MPAIKVPKMWGREVVLYNDAYCCKLLEYDGVRTSSKHYHKEKCETFVVVRGLFSIEWGPVGGPFQDKRFGPGAVLHLEPGTVHRVSCLSEEGGMIVEASSHDDPDDCVRLEPSVNPFASKA
jgi:quercetin dioxygenase-like cupin family protein